MNNIFNAITVNITDIPNSDNLKVAITQLRKNVTGLQFHYVTEE